MKRLLSRLASHLRTSRRSGAFGIASCAAGADALAGLGQHLNQIVGGAISDCVGAQILRSVPLLAGMSSDGLGTSSIATELAAALIGSVLLVILPGLVSKLRSLRHSAPSGAPA